MKRFTRMINLMRIESNKNTSFREFLEEMNPDLFIKIHQDNMKDHYLKRYFSAEYQIDYDDCNDIYDFYDLYSLMMLKYDAFFTKMGREAAHKWLNPSLYSEYSDYLKKETFTFDEIDYIIGLKDEVENEDFYEVYGELYGESVSGIGYAEFLGALVNEYEIFLYN